MRKKTQSIFREEEILDKLKLMPYFFVIGLVLFLDIVTKVVVVNFLSYGASVEILPIFDLTLVYNHGAAFSFLADAGGWQKYLFLGISLTASIFFLAWLFQLRSNQKLLALALSLLLSGALGNLVDRFVNGYVVDFLSFHWNEHYFPAFNVADSAITVGVIFLLLDTFFNGSSKPKNKF